MNSKPVVFNPRPNGPANNNLIQKLNALQLLLINCPSIEIVESTKNRSETTNAEINTVLFLSQFAALYGGKHFLAQQKELQVFAIGQQTEKCLQDLGFKTVMRAIESNSESLLKCLPDKLQTQTIALVKGVGGRDYLEKQLPAQGAQLIVYEVYERQKPSRLKQALAKIDERQAVDIVLATSIEVCQNLLSNAPISLKNTLRRATWVAKSKRVSDYLQTQDINKIVVAEDDLFSTIKGLIESPSHNLA
jgi:uroporphyrinogen-III synthase